MRLSWSKSSRIKIVLTFFRLPDDACGVRSVLRKRCEYCSRPPSVDHTFCCRCDFRNNCGLRLYRFARIVGLLIARLVLGRTVVVRALIGAGCRMSSRSGVPFLGISDWTFRNRRRWLSYGCRVLTLSFACWLRPNSRLFTFPF